jgi:DNA-binding protein WhiA
MSFSSEVKEELSKHLGKSMHCQLAELSALIALEGKALDWQTENHLLEEKYRLLLKKLFNIEEIDAAGEKRILEAVKMWNETTDQPELSDVVSGILVQQNCCRRAYIRGAFLAGGSISDPNKSYHFEIVCRTKAQATQLQELINSFGMDAKIVERKKHQVVYLKEGEQIVDILNIMEAHVALMNLENVRILKEMRNSVNRKVNCETANISKTVNAAVKQLADIEYIRTTAGLDSLPDNLKEIALLRLEYPEAPLGELGTYLEPMVGKSGVNHRLRKLSTIAEQLREEQDVRVDREEGEHQG